jgi:hypothetical protein
MKRIGKVVHPMRRILLQMNARTRSESYSQKTIIGKDLPDFPSLETLGSL